MPALKNRFGLSGELAQVWRLSVPAILTQITSIVMQYIDSAMVGRLGPGASAAIGLVASSTWLMNGFVYGISAGFSVQVAHHIGAGRDADARRVIRHGLIVGLIASALLLCAGAALSAPLPRWLGGEAEILADASAYFLVFALAIPFGQMNALASSCLQCSGNMVTPSVLNAAMCGLDVVFNGLLIFPSQSVELWGTALTLPGAGLGVAGAALGTALAEYVTAGLMVWAVCVRSPRLRLTGGGSWRLQAPCLRTALRVALPMALEHSVLCSAQVASTAIVAPLGTVAVAANSLAVTAESLCYAPGYGLSSAATALVGQSLGAGRKDLARRFAGIAVWMGVAIMSAMGVLMFVLAPWMFSLLTPAAAVRELGASVLRIEAFAEPLFAVSIVAAGAMRGAGDTLVPSVLNLVSMWGVRITAAALLAPRFGLAGVWCAMCGELCVRGCLFLIRLLRGKWLERRMMG